MITIKQAVDQILARVEPTLPDHLTTAQRRKLLGFARSRAIRLNSAWYPDIRDASPAEREALLQHAADEFTAGMQDLVAYIVDKSHRPTLH